MVVYQSWETSTHRIASLDEGRGVVMFSSPAPWPFDYWSPRVRYYVENVAEALDAPGEWHLDRQTGVCSYLPLPGEEPGRVAVVAPVAQQLVLFRGRPAEGIRDELSLSL